MYFNSLAMVYILILHVLLGVGLAKLHSRLSFQIAQMSPALYSALHNLPRLSLQHAIRFEADQCY